MLKSNSSNLYPFPTGFQVLSIETSLELGIPAILTKHNYYQKFAGLPAPVYKQQNHYGWHEYMVAGTEICEPGDMLECPIENLSAEYDYVRDDIPADRCGNGIIAVNIKLSFYDIYRIFPRRSRIPHYIWRHLSQDEQQEIIFNKIYLQPPVEKLIGRHQLYTEILAIECYQLAF